jgi:hypothetical protein
MKQTILFICLYVLLFVSACRTPQKTVSRMVETVISAEMQNEAARSETYNFTDTTKKQDVEINYFKIEFYPPDDKTDTMPDNSSFPDKGAIKSIEGYTVKAKSEQSGVNESKEKAQVTRNTEKNGDINRHVEIREQPAPDPYRWRYILAIIILVGGGAYFALRKTKLITTPVSFVKKLF